MPHQPDNIPAGTQIVARVEVRGTNNALVHPRGAVGIVTRTPAVAGEKFIIRFPDGFETSFERSQFEVLKHFKDRLGNVLPASCWQISETRQQDAGSTFDLEPPLRTIMSQNKCRSNPVPEKVIERLVEKLEPPAITECHRLILLRVMG